MTKLANADYFAVFYKDKVKIFDTNNTRVKVTSDTVLRGWQCEETGAYGKSP